MGILIEGDAYKAAGQELKMVSKNIQKVTKFETIKELIKGQDICFLTETTKSGYISKLTEFNSYATNEDALATILVRKKSNNFKVVDFNVLKELTEDYFGRVSSIVLDINSTKFLLVCIYGPLLRLDQKDFYRNVFDSVVNFVSMNAGTHVLVAGDLNLAIDPMMDGILLSQSKSKEMRASNLILQYRHQLGFVDCLRSLDPRLVYFTSHTVFNCRRLDYFFIPRFLSKRVKQMLVFYDGLGTHERMELVLDISPLLDGNESFDNTVDQVFKNRKIHFQAESKINNGACYCAKQGLDKSLVQLKSLIHHQFNDRPEVFKRNLEIKIIDGNMDDMYSTAVEDVLYSTVVEPDSDENKTIGSKRERVKDQDEDDTRMKKKPKFENYGGNIVYPSSRIFEKLKNLPEPYVCPFMGCSRSFRKGESLKYHIAGHSDERPYSCHRNNCDAQFKREYDLKYHERITHNTKATINCPYPLCSRKVKLINDLKTHIRIVHKKIRPIKCENCSFTCAFHSELKNHTMHVHNDVRPFMCSICKSSFKRKDHLELHISMCHEKLNTFTCDECAKSFPTRNQLKQHTYVHGDAFRHKCQECDYKTHQHPNLVKHIKAVHQGQHDIPCPESTCKIKFKTKPGASKHYKEVHIALRPFSCNICGKSFKRKGHLQGHLSSVHMQ